jgi:hypothetical protein
LPLALKAHRNGVQASSGPAPVHFPDGIVDQVSQHARLPRQILALRDVAWAKYCAGAAHRDLSAQ